MPEYVGLEPEFTTLFPNKNLKKRTTGMSGTKETSGLPNGDTTQQANGGRGSGRSRYRGGRGGQAPGRGKITKATFKGSTEEMCGNVFECFDEQSTRRQYRKTVEALEGYIKKNLRYSKDMAPLFAETMKTPTVVMLNNLVETPTTVEEMIRTEEVKEYVKRTRALKSNFGSLHTVIWGQCSDAMKARIKSLED